MLTTYKYMPNEFQHNMPSLAEDLQEFYDAYELYKRSNNDLDQIGLKEKYVTVVLTIKHRKLNGIISEEYANEMELYLGEFLYD